MKKFISLVLALVLCASVLVMPASAASPSIPVFSNAFSVEQQAVLNSAMAYFNKGYHVQYDSTQLTAQSRGTSGICRLCSEDPPEFAAADQTLYTVCTDFCYGAYFDAYGYRLNGSPRDTLTFYLAAQLSPDDPIVICLYNKARGLSDPETALASRSLLEPGDLIVSNGHCMMYTGDLFADGVERIIHSGGGKVNMTTGMDTIETRGSIRFNEVDQYIYNAGASYDPITSDYFLVLRPLNVLSQKDMTPAAQTRLKYPLIGVDRSASISQYNTAITGEDITMTVTVDNNSLEDYQGVTISEVLPEGATVKSGSVTNGGTLSANGVSWTINVPVGKSVSVSYTATVTASQGQTVTFPSGKVGNLITRNMDFKVGGLKFNKMNIAKLLSAANGRYTTDLSNAKRTDTDFANLLYETLFGIDLALPKTAMDLKNALFNKVPVIDVSLSHMDGKMFRLKPFADMDEVTQRITAMMLPKHMSGYSVYAGKDPQAVASWNTLYTNSEFQERFYEPGDIFIGWKDAEKLKSIDVYIYLGNSKVAAWSTDESVKITSFYTTIACGLKEDVYMVLRPSLIYKDINNLNELGFSDVKSGAWYYTCVKDLVADGMVSGMTETTFAPYANLTMGQALKLITLAVGETEPAKTGSHWASGYLTLAKSRGWLTSDVNLDANVSRLQFCQIAAKAKNITTQPAANPFTDTSDSAVLAMVNAGVISGMTPTIFQPNSLLTRAQIAKIIWGINKVA